jgi:ParB-like chromosome segregation protein Spo0J
MDLPPLEPDLFEKLREDIRLWGIQVPILVDSATGEVIDGRQRKRIATELRIKEVPTIYVSRLSSEERADLRLAVNLYRRHLSRAQMREVIAWSLKLAPHESDRSVAKKAGVNHRTVSGIRRGLESGGEILHLPTREGSDGKKYPAAKPTTFACSASEARRARTLLDRLGDDAPARPSSLRVLHKLVNRRDREALKNCPEARLPARIKIEHCDFRDLPVPDDSVDLIFTDPPWSGEGRFQMPEFAAWAARKLKPDGGVLLIYTGHAGLLEVGTEIAKKLSFIWTISCGNGHYGGTSTRYDLQIRCCWRPILMFARGKYRPGRTFDDAVVSEVPEKTHHRYQQPLSEALFYVKALSGPKSVVCDTFLGSGTTACAVARLGQWRRFWGSEIDPDTYRIARSRITEEVREGGTATVLSKVVSR